MEGVAEAAGVTQLRPRLDESTVPAGVREATATTSVVAAPAGPMAVAPMGQGLGTREQIEAELDGVAADIREFWRYEPDQVLRKTAAYSARLTELYVLLNRYEARDRQYTRVRTQQVQIWLNELDRQFKMASRLIEVSRQDLALLRGHE